MLSGRTGVYVEQRKCFQSETKSHLGTRSSFSVVRGAFFTNFEYRLMEYFRSLELGVRYMARILTVGPQVASVGPSGKPGYRMSARQGSLDLCRPHTR